MNYWRTRSNRLFPLIVLLLTACGRQISTPTATPLIPSPTPITFGKVDVGGYKLWHICAGQGSPTVIVEAGSGMPGTLGWAKVFEAVKDETRICLYDRAGLSQSDKAPTPRTSKDMVKDLHTLLVNSGIIPPYILVGHSIGGLNVRVYANQYPEEIVGMVLVDSVHPDLWSKQLAVLPPETPNDSATLKRFRSSRINFDNDNAEGMDILTSAAQVRATGSLGNKPLIVLSRNPTRGLLPGLPPGVSEKLEQVWQELQIDLLGLSSNSTHIIASKAGHSIMMDEPQLVTDAILTVLDKLRK